MLSFVHPLTFYPKRQVRSPNHESVDELVAWKEQWQMSDNLLLDVEEEEEKNVFLNFSIRHRFLSCSSIISVHVNGKIDHLPRTPSSEE